MNSNIGNGKQRKGSLDFQFQTGEKPKSRYEKEKTRDNSNFGLQKILTLASGFVFMLLLAAFVIFFQSIFEQKPIPKQIQNARKITWRSLPQNKKIQFPEGVSFKNLSDNRGIRLAFTRKGFSKIINAKFTVFEFRNPECKHFNIEIAFNPKKFTFQIISEDNVLHASIREKQKTIRVETDTNSLITKGFSFILYNRN